MVLILRLFTNDSTHGRQMYIVGVLESIKKIYIKHEFDIAKGMEF